MMYGLRLEHITFSFSHSSTPFFNGLSALFPAQTIHFIKGKNGVGKSTLFRIMQGIFHPMEIVHGTLDVAERTYTLSSYLQPIAPVKLVPQQFDRMLADQFSFTYNLQFANMPRYPTLQHLPAYTPLPALIDRFAIDIHKPIRLLSGGQRQILAILMALQKPTSVLLLDEPTAALDEKNAQLAMAFLHELIATIPITIIVISHDTELVDTYATQGYYELVVDSSTHQRTLLFHPRTPLA